jgi:hypothetical protein
MDNLKSQKNEYFSELLQKMTSQFQVSFHFLYYYIENPFSFRFFISEFCARPKTSELRRICHQGGGQESVHTDIAPRGKKDGMLFI